MPRVTTSRTNICVLNSGFILVQAGPMDEEIMAIERVASHTQSSREGTCCRGHTGEPRVGRWREQWAGTFTDPVGRSG